MTTVVHCLAPAPQVHPATWWLAKSGKLLLLLAGLVVVLDLVGHERLRNAHRWASRRRGFLIAIQTFRQYGNVVDKLAETVRGKPIESATPVVPVTQVMIPRLEGYRYSVSPRTEIPPLLSREDVENFATRVTKNMSREHACTKPHNDEICLAQAQFIEAEAAREVARHLALPDEAQSFLVAQYGRYREDRDLYRFAISLVLLIMGGTLWLAIAHLIPLAMAWIVIAIGFMFGVTLQNPGVRVNLDLRLTVAPIRALSSWGLMLLGKQANGNPIKWTALVFFIAGSLFDLIWG
jgi:hypothetical protein